MPAFSFEALDPEGRTAKGVVEADSARSARSLVRARGLVPLAVEVVAHAGPEAGQAAATGKGLNRALWSSRVFNSANLATKGPQL